MSKANEPAFPSIESDPDYLRGHDAEASTTVVARVYSTGGLSKREYFAAMAMQGLLAAHHSDEWERCAGRQHTAAEWLVINAVDVADALLAELEKRP